QIDHSDPWKVEEWSTPLHAMVAVTIENRTVWVRPWLHVVAEGNDTRVPVILLDTRLEQNHPEDRTITDRLYGGNQAYRLKQEAVLGIAGARILEVLGFNIRKFHLNEGHAALLTLYLLAKEAAKRAPIEAQIGN